LGEQSFERIWHIFEHSTNKDFKSVATREGLRQKYLEWLSNHIKANVELGRSINSSENNSEKRLFLLMRQGAEADYAGACSIYLTSTQSDAGAVGNYMLRLMQSETVLSACGFKKHSQ
jgi:hypothetical protein